MMNGKPNQLCEMVLYGRVWQIAASDSVGVTSHLANPGRRYLFPAHLASRASIVKRVSPTTHVLTLQPEW